MAKEKAGKRMPVKDNIGLGRGRVKGYNRAEAEPRGYVDSIIDKFRSRDGGFLKRGRYSGR